MTAMATRSKQLNFRVSPEEMQEIDQLCAHYGLGVGELLRMLVQKELSAVGKRRQPLLDSLQKALVASLSKREEPVDFGQIFAVIKKSQDPEDLARVPAALNDLRRAGLVTKTGGGKFELTKKANNEDEK